MMPGCIGPSSIFVAPHQLLASYARFDPRAGSFRGDEAQPHPRHALYLPDRWVGLAMSMVNWLIGDFVRSVGCCYFRVVHTRGRASRTRETAPHPFKPPLHPLPGRLCACGGDAAVPVSYYLDLSRWTSFAQFGWAVISFQVLALMVLGLMVFGHAQNCLCGWHLVGKSRSDP